MRVRLAPAAHVRTIFPIQQTRLGYPHPVCSELENSGIRVASVIAVSLNVGGGVRLIKSAKLYMCTQKYYKHNEDGRTSPGVRGHGSVPLSHSGNVVTRIGLQQTPSVWAKHRRIEVSILSKIVFTILCLVYIAKYNYVLLKLKCMR